MPRDYAHRSKPKPRRAATKSTGRSAKKAPAPVKKPPYFAMVIAVALVGAFGYLLMQLNGTAETQPAPVAETTKPKVTTRPQSQLKETPLPPPPAEDWQYIEELENKEVVVDVPPPEPSQGPYQMQCASFRSSAQAESMKAKIAFQGKEAMVRRAEGKSGTWYKVVLGPYEQKRSAEKDRHILARSGIKTCKIWKWQG
ncbi:sporulation protein [Corallincola holothuriorum]|uniref:Sporulation protein n=1 Tax=Corallincola holothuriorum TaxID=2282215 RepID=A0A368N6D8_9GAMM|nr:SPOR domain-containing protein [Corallincola holothuriorum]RCU45121.1 sporulation protein [Corallincola holothuriorum]